MPLAPETIQEFQAAYREAFNEDLAFDDARIMFSELILFFRELLQQQTKKDLCTGSEVDLFAPDEVK